MAQIKLLKIASDGVPLEMDIVNDSIELNSFTVNGSSAVFAATGLDMKNTPVVGVSAVQFQNPTTSTINQTAGVLIVDNIMAKDRENLMAVSGAVAFPVITDTAAQVDAFRLPAIAGVPTASPANAGEGHVVWNSVNDTMYVWNGFSWEPQGANTDTYLAGTAIAARDAVYISAASSISPALAGSVSSSYAIGFASASAASGGSVVVQSNGILPGFSGLTPAARYYLSATAAGQIQSSIPTGAGNSIVKMGLARSATELHIQIEELGRRAS